VTLALVKKSSHLMPVPVSKPIVVDLDGTLLRSDMLVESAVRFLKSAPLRFYEPLRWLVAGGKPTLKSRLAAETHIDASTLPYNPGLVAWLRDQRAAGRPIVLATATHERIARRIAAHLGIFDKVFASTDTVNLSAERKRDALLAAFGEQGFDYVGNSVEDVPVWQAANRAYLVDAQDGVERVARQHGNVERVFETPRNRFVILARSLRVHQWLKNLLLLVPLLAGHHVSALPLVASALIALIAFSLCASSVYLLNDLIDLEDDRLHPVKRHRPLASGAMPLLLGVALCPALLVSAFALAWAFLPLRYVGVLFCYYSMTLAYSMFLKPMAMVDVVVLAALYTARIVAGAAAIQVHLTFWLLAFSMFLFLSLALVKRYAELHSMLKLGVVEPSGRGYMTGDLALISSLGTASGYLAVLVLALYIQDHATAVLYRTPQLIWLACPLLLFWISRMWLEAHRGNMHDDPVVFAARDRVSIAVLGLCGVIFCAAI
jgi:4-hydroxybenzoate polyprenyltransferase/phosphoserine phosphatase